MNEAAKKSTIRIDTSEIMPSAQRRRGTRPPRSPPFACRSTKIAQRRHGEAGCQIDCGAEESAKKRTARIDLNEVLDENDDIFKRRTALTGCRQTCGSDRGAGVPRTIRIKRPDAPPTAALRTSTPVAEEEDHSRSATVMEQETPPGRAKPRASISRRKQRNSRRLAARPSGSSDPRVIVTSRPLVIGGDEIRGGTSGSTAIPKEERLARSFRSWP